jgi:hypothetical protein
MRLKAKNRLLPRGSLGSVSACLQALAEPRPGGSVVPIDCLSLKVNTETKDWAMKRLGVFPGVGYGLVEDLLIHSTGELIV